MGNAPIVARPAVAKTAGHGTIVPFQHPDFIISPSTFKRPACFGSGQIAISITAPLSRVFF
jgi:hypothetical protein